MCVHVCVGHELNWQADSNCSLTPLREEFAVNFLERFFSQRTRWALLLWAPSGGRVVRRRIHDCSLMLVSFSNYLFITFASDTRWSRRQCICCKTPTLVNHVTDWSQQYTRTKNKTIELMLCFVLWFWKNGSARFKCVHHCFFTGLAGTIDLIWLIAITEQKLCERYYGIALLFPFTTIFLSVCGNVNYFLHICVVPFRFIITITRAQAK